MDFEDSESIIIFLRPKCNQNISLILPIGLEGDILCGRTSICWILDEYSEQRVLNQERKIEEARSKSDSFCTRQRTVRTNYLNRQLSKRVIEYENLIF